MSGSRILDVQAYGQDVTPHRQDVTHHNTMFVTVICCIVRWRGQSALGRLRNQNTRLCLPKTWTSTNASKFDSFFFKFNKFFINSFASYHFRPLGQFCDHFRPIQWPLSPHPLATCFLEFLAIQMTRIVFRSENWCFTRELPN